MLAPRSGQGEITNGTFRFPLPSSAGFPVLPIFSSVQHILFFLSFLSFGQTGKFFRGDNSNLRLKVNFIEVNRYCATAALPRQTCKRSMQEKITPKMYRHTHTERNFHGKIDAIEFCGLFFVADLSFKLGEETQTLETTVRVK